MLRTYAYVRTCTTFTYSALYFRHTVHTVVLYEQSSTFDVRRSMMKAILLGLLFIVAPVDIHGIRSGIRSGITASFDGRESVSIYDNESRVNQRESES